MTYFKVKSNIISLLFLVFSLLFSFSLCAENEIEYLTQNSINNTVCVNSRCFFPSQSLTDKDIIVSGNITWNKNRNLILHTRGNIVFDENAKLIVEGNVSLTVKAGMEPGSTDKLSKIDFKAEEAQILMKGKGGVKIYYHPTKGQEIHKYLNPQYNFYKDHIDFADGEDLTLYMLVNNVYNLQNIGIYLSGNYALSQNIDASVTKEWNNGQGFEPLKDDTKNMPFSGYFDGNGYAIENLYINRPEEKKVGLFGISTGFENHNNVIENLTLQNFNITGNHYVGALAGWAANTKILNVHLINFSIKSKDIAGGFIGAMYKTQFNLLIFLSGQEELGTNKYRGYVAGSANNCNGGVFFVLSDIKNNGQETPYDKFNKASKLLNKEYPYIGDKNDTDLSDSVITEKEMKELPISLLEHVSK